MTLPAPFVAPEWLAERLGDPSLVVLEVSFDPPSRAVYPEGHVPGSHYVYWKDLCWHETERRFPDPETMAARLAAFGADDDSTIVLFGDPVQFATYAYWAMTMAGQRGAVIVDGGRVAWEARGLPTTQDVPTPAAGSRTAGVADAGTLVGRDEVLAGLTEGASLLLDVRSADEYRGERVSPPWAPFDHGAERGGHIPGAVNVPHFELLREDETLKPADELRRILAAVGVTADRPVAAYCRLSHRATLAWLILTRILEHPDVRIYDGSWTEWGSIVGMPIER